VTSTPPSPSPSFSTPPLPSLYSSSSSSRSGSSGENGDSSPIHVAREKGASRKQRVGSVLDQLIEEQSSRLGARNNPVVWEMSQRASCRQGAQRFSDSENVWEEAEEEVSAVTRWARYLKHLPVDFFSSHEARMQFPVENMDAGSEEGAGVGETGMGGERRRCVAYAGLSLCHSPENCPDLLYCYEQYYEIKIQRGGRKEGYSQFRAVAGQLARFAVSAEVACAETFAVPGGLFNLVRESRLIRAFIGGFQQHAQASTVYSKATLLGGLCRMAKQHFGKISSSETPAVLSHIDETINLLGGFRRVEKATSRRHTAVMRDQDRRDAFIAPKDWFWLQKRIEEDMRRVLSGVCGLSNQLGLDVHVYLDENHNLVRKYSLLLSVFLVLTGGGQRPQVYCSLQHPAERVVQKWEEESGNGAASSVKLYPKAEKTPRGTFSPGVLFPDTAGSFFATYSRMIRPAVMRGCGKVDRDLADSGRTFLVHTETGMALSGENLRNTLRYYVGGMGGLSGDLSRVTVMTVRASFASMMFRSFRQGSFPGQSCEEFLGELAETMNTSTEMLRNTYISANGKEFDEAASAFLRASRED
jgi:hypothetical protein